MSDTEGAKGVKGWTDKERLTYLFALIDNSEVKFNYNGTPRSAGRTIIACQRMVERLRGTLKNELEALKAGTAMPDDTPKKKAASGTPKSTPRKRKTKDADADGNDEDTPTKKGRKKVVSEP